MTPGSSHVHKARTIVNSQQSHKDLWSLSGWSKDEIRRKFESAMAIFKVRDHRTYAQALLSKHHNAHKGHRGHLIGHNTPQHSDPNALKQLMVNTGFNTYKVKRNIVNTSKQRHRKGGQIHTEKDTKAVSSDRGSNSAHTQPLDSTIPVSDCYSIVTSIRFQLLNNIEDGSASTPDESEPHRVHSQVYHTQVQTGLTSPREVAQPDPDLTPDPISVPEYHKCKEQIGTKFGCVPLAPIHVYRGPIRHWDCTPDILTAHKLIRQSGLPNFLGLRIPVSTNLNVNSWRRHLVDYFDQQLPDLTEFGFPLDFDRSRDLQSTLVNHASARLYPDHVGKYIQEEVGFQAMLGPLDVKPFDIHISPFMTRAKSDSDSRRTIMDLSFPKGYSINDGVLKDKYLGTNFQMHYPSIDSIIRTLNELGPAAAIIKVDISRAFRHIRIDPGDIDLLGL